jgi:hypothetical protein
MAATKTELNVLWAMAVRNRESISLMAAATKTDLISLRMKSASMAILHKASLSVERIQAARDGHIKVLWAKFGAIQAKALATKDQQ